MDQELKIFEEIERLKKLTKQKDREIEKLKKDIEDLHNSISYKIGRWITKFDIGKSLKRLIKNTFYR